MTFEHFIFAFCNALGLTQAKFSERLEEQEGYARYVDPRNIQRWEHDTHRPRKATMSRIRQIDAPLFDQFWSSARRQHELQQAVSEAARSRRFQRLHWFIC